MKQLLCAHSFPKTIERALQNAFADYTVCTPQECDLSTPNGRILLAAHLQSHSYDPALLRWIEDCGLFPPGTRMGVFVYSPTALHTREAGVQLLYHANKAGARMPGRSLVEAAKNLDNLTPLSAPLHKSPAEILQDQLNSLARRLEQEIVRKENPRLSVWTIGKPDASATLSIWDLIRPHLSGIQIDLLSFGNENIRDCRGCAYELCKKMGEASRCIYEDYVVEKLYPSIEAADGILILTPNYNDMLPANFVSAINRMTALFRKRKFFDKNLYSLIVTGHSGAELLSRQLISALHINKTFALPPHFTWEVRAHNVQSVKENPALPAQAQIFAETIVESLKAPTAQ
ncbi:MAG: flavodoxin family protein [Tissierellia bacterium]|nr:flavodoxin family protein [Tissierellia bacterium]